MIMQAEATKRYTSEEYLDLEEDSDIRHEYIQGEIIPVTGGTPNHNDIFSQKGRRGNEPFQSPSPSLGEGFRVRAD